MAEPVRRSSRAQSGKSQADRVKQFRARAGGGFLVACRLARRLRGHLASIAFDRRLGVRTAGSVSLRELDLEDADRVDYVPSGWLTLRRALAKCNVSESDVFLDFGSGKGQVVLQAAMCPFRRVLGVEISPQLHEIAVQNVRQARGRLKCPNIALVNLPAGQYDIPDDVSIVYLFNPFRGEVFNNVVHALLASVERHPRPLRIIYHNARDEAVLLATGRVQTVQTIRSGPGSAPSRVYHVVPPSRTDDGGQTPATSGDCARR